MTYSIRAGTQITPEVLKRFIDSHKVQAHRLREMGDYYLGDKQLKTESIDGRPNLEAYTNLAKYITDTATGYFVGVPPKYTFDKDVAGDKIQQIFDDNNETSTNYKLAEDMSIYGAGFDLTWLDEQAQIRISALDPINTFSIRENTVEEKRIAAVRLFEVDNLNGTTEKCGELYTDTEITEFTYDGVVSFGEIRVNVFGSLPISEYKNNSYYKSDFEWAVKNIDLYNRLLSNTSNDLQSIANAFLAIVGMAGTTEEDIEAMNKHRVIKVHGDGAGVHFVTKDINDTAVENHKKTLKQDILQVVGVPDLSDENFAGNASGVALEYKMWALDQLRAKKQQGMDDGLFNRLKLIATALNLKGENIRKLRLFRKNGYRGDIASHVTINYTRNMPKDTAAIVSNAVQLTGVVSPETQFGMLEPVTGVSVKDEMARAGQYGEELLEE